MRLIQEPQERVLSITLTQPHKPEKQPYMGDDIDAFIKEVDPEMWQKEQEMKKPCK